MSKTQAQGIVDSILKSLPAAAVQDDRGEVEARPGQQTNAGEKIKIAASRKLAFSPAKTVKELLND